MTTQRALKRLVRDRMARTGESYTTAYRQVTARRRRPGAGHRESALVHRMLAAAGVDLSEAMVCGLGGGIGFLYAVFHYAALAHPTLTVVSQHHPTPWVEAVAGHLGQPLRRHHSSSAAAALRALRAAVDAGRCPWIVLARGGLPWHDDVSALEAADPYPVVVEACRGDDVVVLDAEQETLDAGRLAEAWAAHRKGRFALTSWDGALESDLEPAVDRAIRTTRDHLVGPVLGNRFDVNFGLSGLRRLRDDLADVRTRRGWRQQFAAEPAFSFAMGRLGWLAACLTLK